MKVLNIVGARPNLVKIAPLMREVRKRTTIETLLLHTGQHYDEKLSNVFFRQMDIPRPDVRKINNRSAFSILEQYPGFLG
jgi:UDP-N-acetylglucosamine 2-epimerase (non-hydrolysing)